MASFYAYLPPEQKATPISAKNYQHIEQAIMLSPDVLWVSVSHMVGIVFRAFIYELMAELWRRETNFGGEQKDVCGYG